MKHRKSTKNLYSPYRKNKEETMEVWYERYLSDESRYLNLNGHIYSKIIERNEFHANPGFSLLVVFEPLENIEIGNTVIDEEGREFIIERFDVTRFEWGISEWAYKLVSACIVGESYDIGEYLRIKKERIIRGNESMVFKE